MTRAVDLPTLYLDRKFSRSFSLHVLKAPDGTEIGAWKYMSDVVDALVALDLRRILVQIEQDRYILKIAPIPRLEHHG